jgi:hypothetical protein
MDAENKPLAATEKPVQPAPGDAEAAPPPSNTAATDEVFDRSPVLEPEAGGIEAAPRPGNAAATDEVFDQPSVLEPEPGGPEAAATAEPSPAEPAEADASEQAPPPMLHPDYVRELQQEFEVQEDEGKL